jgi:hypothetical protein
VEQGDAVVEESWVANNLASIADAKLTSTVFTVTGLQQGDSTNGEENGVVLDPEGGGVHVKRASLLLKQTVVNDNAAIGGVQSRGGGLFATSSTIQHCGAQGDTPIANDFSWLDLDSMLPGIALASGTTTTAAAAATTTGTTGTTGTTDNLATAMTNVSTFAPHLRVYRNLAKLGGGLFIRESEINYVPCLDEVVRASSKWTSIYGNMAYDLIEVDPDRKVKDAAEDIVLNMGSSLDAAGYGQGGNVFVDVTSNDKGTAFFSSFSRWQKDPPMPVLLSSLVLTLFWSRF